MPAVFAGEVEDYILKGNQAVKDRRYKDAVQEYEKVINIDPNNSQANLLLGMTYAQMKEYEKAVKYAKKASELSPAYSSFYHLGLIYGAKRETAKALEALDKALRINPESYTAHYQKGLIHSAREEYDEALQAYRKSVELNPNFDNAYSALVGIYYTTGDKAAVSKLIADLRTNEKTILADILQKWMDEKETAAAPTPV